MQLRPGKPIVVTIRVESRLRARRARSSSPRRSYPGAGWQGDEGSRTTAASAGGPVGPPAKPSDLGVRITDGHDMILRGSPNTYTVTVTNRGPTTVSRLRLRVVTRLVSASYDNATGGYDPASGIWSGLSLARGGRVTLIVSGTAPTLHRNAHRDRRHLACCGLQRPCARKQQVDRQDHHRHPVGPTTIER